MSELHTISTWLKTKKLADLDTEDWRELKKKGFSDAQIARSTGESAHCVCLCVSVRGFA
jgi:hypothetical protein